MDNMNSEMSSAHEEKRERGKTRTIYICQICDDNWESNGYKHNCDYYILDVNGAPTECECPCDS